METIKLFAALKKKKKKECYINAVILGDCSLSFFLSYFLTVLGLSCGVQGFLSSFSARLLLLKFGGSLVVDNEI